MNQIITITEHNGNQAVSARELHCFLESKQDFSTWMKNRIEKYGLIEKVDFEVFHNFIENPKGGRPLTEYALTIDAAKELSMVEGNDKGRQARRYFIEVEKKAKMLQKPLSTLDILKLAIQGLEEQQKELSEVKQDIAGYATLQKIHMPLKLASNLGRKASKICKDLGIIPDEIYDPRFGVVKSYPETVLSEVFNESYV